MGERMGLQQALILRPPVEPVAPVIPVTPVTPVAPVAPVAPVRKCYPLVLFLPDFLYDFIEDFTFSHGSLSLSYLGRQTFP